MKTNKIVLTAVTGLVIGLAAVQAKASDVGIENPLGPDTELQDIIGKIIGFLFGLAILIAPIFIIWGGFEIATAAGAEQKMKDGRQKITYALVGLVVMALANAFVTVIKDILGV